MLTNGIAPSSSTWCGRADAAAACAAACIFLLLTACAPEETAPPLPQWEIDASNGVHTRGYDPMVGKGIMSVHVYEKGSGKSIVGFIALYPGTVEDASKVRFKFPSIRLSPHGEIHLDQKPVKNPPMDGFVYVVAQDGQFWKSGVTVDEMRSLGGIHPISSSFVQTPLFQERLFPLLKAHEWKW